MLTNPRIGQRVRLHYAERSRDLFPAHGETGTVVTVGRKRPRNHCVKLDLDGVLVSVPCGNLQRVRES